MIDHDPPVDGEIISPADVVEASKQVSFYAGKVAGAAEVGDVVTVRDATIRLAILIGALARYAIRQEPTAL